MSTLAYAGLTTRREQAASKKSGGQSSPGVGTYIDAFAALVPAEVLTVHAVIISLTTKTVDAVTEIVELGTLFWAFFGLILLSVFFYVFPRLVSRTWDRLDYVRMVIPPLAFIGWTMLQRTTAFDAIFPSLSVVPRMVIALFLGVILGVVALSLAKKADQG